MKFETKYDVNDYIGKQFYWLTVIGPSDELAKDGSKQWKFKCVCGNVIDRPPARVIGEECHSKSCGCMRYKNIVHKPHDRANLQKVDANSLIGEKKNMLTVVGFERPKEKGRLKLKCKCDCGNTVFVLPYQFKNGSVKSCGCLKTGAKGPHNWDNKRKTHGKSGSRIYDRWVAMISRCYNKDAENYERYGGRGIYVVEEWRYDPTEFIEWSILHGANEPGATIDRIDNDGPYSPENCRWVTMHEQSRNKRNTRLITIDGETMCITDWCSHFGISNQSVYKKVKSGMSFEEAILYFANKHKAAP